jgi:L-amino acid N-acyltransferase YncA
MTDRSITFRPAEARDAEAIVDVFRAAMPSEIVAVNVLGLPKSPAFVRCSIEASQSGGNDRYWVAEETGLGIVGFAQLRGGLRTAYINNLHVIPSRQGMGLGRHLLRLMAADAATYEIGADVFDGSTVSAGLFRRAGFRPVGTYHWHVLAPPAEQAVRFVVHGLAMADAVHAAFDLSTIRVETPEHFHEVGRLCRGLFRLTTPSAFTDAALRPALAAIDPARSVLLIVQDRDDPVAASPFLVSRRLMARHEDVAARHQP